MPGEFSPAHNILGREVRSGVAPLGRNYLRTEIAGPIKLSRRALYDDGQMINSNVINTRVEFVFNKHGCCWRAEICVDRDVLENIDIALILKEEQRNAIKAFVDRKYVFAVEFLSWPRWSTLWSYYVALIGCRYIQLSEEAFFFMVRLKHTP